MCLLPGSNKRLDIMHPAKTQQQVKPDLAKALTALRAKGVEGKVGIVGFCWGGKISTLASQVNTKRAASPKSSVGGSLLIQS